MNQYNYCQVLVPGAFLSELQKLDNVPWRSSSNCEDAKQVFHVDVVDVLVPMVNTWHWTGIQWIGS
jgi:hypothetical protein